MVNPLSLRIICGSNSLPRDEDEDYNGDERAIRSAGSSPRKPSKPSRHHNKNPYSARGLDKFSALLAEMEERRQRIYSEMGPDEISFVQFDYSKDNNCKPIVVKARPGQTQVKKSGGDQGGGRSEVGPVVRAGQRSLLEGLMVNVGELRRPRYYLPMVVIVILMFLALFGRSVAIMCTSIGWYLIPTIANGDGKQRKKSGKKKVLVGHHGGVSSFKDAVL